MHVWLGITVCRCLIHKVNDSLFYHITHIVPAKHYMEHHIDMHRLNKLLKHR